MNFQNFKQNQGFSSSFQRSGNQNTFSQQNNKVSQGLNQDDIQKLRVDLTQIASKKRVDIKVGKLYRFRKGEKAIQMLLDNFDTDFNGFNSTQNSKLSMNDSNVQKLFTQNQIQGQKFELLDFQMKMDNYIQNSQKEDSMNNFSKVFEEMLKNHQRAFLQIDEQFTHLSLAFKQYGQQGQIFRIVALLTKQQMSINCVYSSIKQMSGEAYIIVGQIFEQQKYPIMALINRGKRSEYKIGPNKLHYDPLESNEVKIWFSKRDLPNISPFEDQSVDRSEISIEIFFITMQYGSSQIQYRVGEDIQQQILPENQAGWEYGLDDYLPKVNKQIDLSLEIAIKKPNLNQFILKQNQGGKPAASTNNELIQRLQGGFKSNIGVTKNNQSQNSTNFIPSSTIQNLNQCQFVQPRTTRAQLLKEQNAQKLIDKNKDQSSVAIPLGYQGSSFNKPYQPPSFTPMQNQAQEMSFSFKNNFTQEKNGIQNSIYARNSVSFGGNPQNQVSFIQKNNNYQTQNQQSTLNFNFNQNKQSSSQNNKINEPQQSKLNFQPSFQRSSTLQQQTFNQQNNYQSANQNIKPVSAFNYNYGFQQNNFKNTNITPNQQNFQCNNQSNLNFKSNLNDTYSHAQQLQNNQQSNFQNYNSNNQMNFNSSNTNQNKIQFPNFNQSQQLQFQNANQNKQLPKFEPISFQFINQNQNNQQNSQNQQNQQAQQFQIGLIKYKLEPFFEILVGNQIPINFINECILDLENNIINQNIAQNDYYEILNIIHNQPAILAQRIIDTFNQQNQFQSNYQSNQALNNPQMQFQNSQNQNLNERDLFTEFRKIVLFSSDLGVYLPTIHQNLLFVSKNRYIQLIKNAYSNFKNIYFQDRSKDIENLITKQQIITTCQAILKKLFNFDSSNENKNFQKPYLEHLIANKSKESQQHAIDQQELDLIFQCKEKQTKFYCHQYVFKQNSSFIENVIKKNQDRQQENIKITKQKEEEKIRRLQMMGQPVPLKKNVNEKPSNIQKIQLEDWVSISTFEFYIRYIYTGKLSLDINEELWDVANKSRKRSIDDFTCKELIDFYKFAHFTQNDQLENLLLLEHIIPRMSVEMALHYLIIRSRKKDLIIFENLRQSEQLLMDYSCFYVAKHLPKQLVEKRIDLHDIDKNILIQIIHKSFRYLQGGQVNQFGSMMKTNNKDLELLVQFAAENVSDRDVFKLLQISQNKFKRCFAFDQQKILQMREFISSIDVNEIYYCDLTLSDDLGAGKSYQNLNQFNEMLQLSGKDNKEALKSSKNPQIFLQQLLESRNFENKQKDRTFLHNESINQKWNKNSKQMNETMYQDKFDLLKPDFDYQIWKSYNNFLPEKYQNLMKSSEPATFIFTIQLNEIKSRINETNEQKGLTIFSNVFDCSRRSWHLKIDINSNLEMSLWIIERGLPIGINEFFENFSTPHFSSVILEFKVSSKSIDNLYCPIFFSFAHNANQCIGVENICNLSQIQNNESIQIQVNLKENILHSGVMHYISQNFEKYLNIYLSSIQDEQNKEIYQSIAYKQSGLMNMTFPQIYQLLSSNNLKIECENTILTYLYHYCSQEILFQKYNNRKTCQHVVDLISQSMRFCFVDVHNILSAIRKCDGLRSSKIFQQMALNEMWTRISSCQSKDISLSYFNDKEYQMRYSFNLNKIKQQGRFKNQDDDKDEKEKMLELIQQVFNWAITASEIQQNSSKDQKKQVINEQQIEQKNQKQKIIEVSNRAIYRGQLSDINLNIDKENKYKRNHDYQINEQRRGLDEYPRKRIPNFLSKQPPQNYNRFNQNIPKFLQANNKENQAPNKEMNGVNFSSIQFTLGSIESKKLSPPNNLLNSTYIAERKIRQEREVKEFTNILNQLSPIRNKSLDDSRQKNNQRNYIGENYQGFKGNYKNPFIIRDSSKNNQYQMKTKLPYGRNNQASYQRSSSVPVLNDIFKGVQWGFQQIQNLF